MSDTTTFDYYYGDESNQFSFYRIPRQLITGEQFKRLSTDAKLLYLLFFPQRQQTRKKLCQPFSSHNALLPVVSLTEKCSCQHHSTEQEHGVL